MVLVLFCIPNLGVHSILAYEEQEIGRSNLGKWNGGEFYEYMTKEFLSENDVNDTITYRIRYRLKHWGSWYTYQVTPINLFVNDVYVTTFTSGIDVRVSNEDRINGVYDITMKKGVKNKMELRDTGVSITVINVEGSVFAPLPTFQVNFEDGFDHVLKEEEVTKYESATPPNNPIQDGYRFIGWDKDYTNITSNKTIRATWEKRSYTLRISPNNGIWNGTREDRVYRQSIGDKRQIEHPTREGYIFNGWDVQGFGFLDGFVKQLDETKNFDVKYSVSTRKDGWSNEMRNTNHSFQQPFSAIRIDLGNGLQTYFSIQYRVYIQNQGWSAWKKNGETAGEHRSNSSLEAIEIRLQGAIAQYFDVEYRIHTSSSGWTTWKKNEEGAGAIGKQEPLTSIQIRLHRKLISIPEHNMFYSVNADATLIAQWLEQPHFEVAYDRWFLVQETIRKEDILQSVKAYDEFQSDISNMIVMQGYESIKQHTVGDYTIQLSATSALGNTCYASIGIHIVDELTKEMIRGISSTYVLHLDRNSKWIPSSHLLNDMLNNKESIVQFELYK